jgi:phosphoglycerate dehydrogenase-like enzyme
MAGARRVLVTDYAWPDLDVERSVLAPAGVELVVARTGGEAELRGLAHDVEAILTCWARVPASVLAAAPHCLTVARYGVGLDNIDVDEATRLGMVVSNVPDYCVDEVADHTMALLLASARRLSALQRDVRANGWDNTAGGMPRRLSNAVLGLVGFGAVARAVARRAVAHGLRVVAYARTTPPPGPEGVTFAASLAELLAASDIVSLHLPLAQATRGIIGAAELALCKPSAVLLNTARGGLVDTAALVRALESGALAGAGLDVTDPEPLPAGHPLRSRDDVILTPHAAFYSDGSIRELAGKAAHNVLDVLSGRLPRWVSNPAVLDSPALRPRLTA